MQEAEACGYHCISAMGLKHMPWTGTKTKRVDKIKAFKAFRLLLLAAFQPVLQPFLCLFAKRCGHSTVHAVAMTGLRKFPSRGYVNPYSAHNLLPLLLRPDQMYCSD